MEENLSRKFVDNALAILKDKYKVKDVERLTGHSIGYFARNKGASIKLETAISLARLCEMTIEEILEVSYEERRLLDCD